MFYNARWYDPYLNRFSQPDTIVPNPYNSQDYDRYSYVQNNPVRYIDASGHCIGPLAVVCFVAGIALVVSAIDLIESNSMEMVSAYQQPGFTSEQDALQRWQDNCMGQCHYPNSANSTGSPGPRPETPLTDQYSSGMAGVVQGTTTLLGGISTLASISAGVPMPGTMNNLDARKWYLQQEARIPDMLNADLPLEQQAKTAFELRNYFRTRARDLMSDRILAEKLMLGEPNLTWEQVVQKAINKGYAGDDLWRYIIGSSQRSRPSVNQQLGIPK